MEDLLTMRDVQNILCVKRNAVYRLMERNDFPRPVRFNARMIRWRRSELQEYIDSLPRGGSEAA